MRILLPLALLALALSTPLSAGAGFVVVAPYALAPPVCAEGACAPIP